MKNDHELGKIIEPDTRTLKLSETDCANLASILLHEREYMFTLGARETPVIDGLIQKLHNIIPAQNWIRFLEPIDTKLFDKDVDSFGVDQTLRDQVIEFHTAFCPDQGIGKGPPAIPSINTVRLRWMLITEEYFEGLGSILTTMSRHLPDFTRLKQCQIVLARAAIEDAINKWIGPVNLIELVDALADLDYVVEGTRLALGVDGKPIADEVHRSNMSKRGGHRREDGKWVKPESYSPADIEGELKKTGMEAMKYVIQSGTKMLIGYGFPPTDMADWRSEYPLSSNEIEVTDKETGRPATLSLGLQQPIIFHDSDGAQRIIDRFSISEARIIPWRD